MASKNIPNCHFLIAQLILLAAWFMSQIESPENGFKGVAMVARYTVYLLTARGSQEAIRLLLTSISTKRLSLPKLYAENKFSWLSYIVTLSFVMKSELKLYGEDFTVLLAAFIVSQYLKTFQKSAPTINYGTGMACSYFEGYLKHVIPSDGMFNKDLVDKLSDWGDGESVVFPVKRLFLVITKSLHCPPDLGFFNNKDKYSNRDDVPRIDPCIEKTRCLKVVKDVAGVKNRRYQSTIYNIHWSNCSQRPVYLAAEFATPLHTLHLVLQNQHLYRELIDVDKEELVRDFVLQLENILERDPATRGKCVIVHFDDSRDSEEYLPYVLLDKIAELEPEFRDVIDKHYELNRDDNIPLPQITPELGGGGPAASPPPEQWDPPSPRTEQDSDLGDPDRGATQLDV